MLRISKKGEALVEAGISLPIIILVIMLLIRVFVFYLDIMTSGISEHNKAREAMDVYRGKVIRVYKSENNIKMNKNDILRKNLNKKITTKAYLINEDFLVRSRGVINAK